MASTRQRTVTGTSLVAVVGMACLSVIFDASFFPLTLMPEAVEGSYRLFNLTVGIAGALAGLAAVPIVAMGNHAQLGMMGVAGYSAVAVSLCTASSVVPGAAPGWAIAAGIGCGAGLAVTLTLWLGVLSCFAERTAMLALGWQALLGAVVFTTAGLSIKTLTNEASLALCVVSAMLFMLVYQKVPQLGAGLRDDPSPLEGFSAFHRQGIFARTLVPAAAGFFALCLIFGAVEAVALGHDGSPRGEVASYLGAPLGAALFLVNAYASRRRDYGTMLKSIFLVLLVAFWIPAFDVTVVVLSCGFHLTLLLLESLAVDECASRRRMLMLLSVAGQGATRLLTLGGLYLPGRFGVLSYSYFDDSSLPLFLAYAVFAVFIASSWYERRTLRRELDALQLADACDTGQPASPDADPASHPVVTPPADAAGSPAPTSPRLEVLARIARCYSLTKRETEILDLYAHGRDINVVCQTLVLSRNTVKGHTKNLYAKLGVHSKQELIDLIEKHEKCGCP